MRDMHVPGSFEKKGVINSSLLLDEAARARTLFVPNPSVAVINEILRGIVLKEKPIDDVIEWLRHSPGIAWTEFVQNKAEVAQAQKRAEEKVCHQKLFEEHVKFVEELKTRDRSACPRCHSKDDVIPILYGLPKPHLLLFPEHDQYVLGGCVIFPNSERWHCRKCGQNF